MRGTFSTGLHGLDDLLGGGLREHHITFFFGPGGSGKTNLLLWLAARALSIGGKVYWIETAGIPIQRLAHMSHGQEIDGEKTLNRLQVQKVRSLRTQEAAINQACILSAKTSLRPAMIIVDSLTEFVRLHIRTNREPWALQSLSMQMSYLREAARSPGVMVSTSGQTWIDYTTGRVLPVAERTLEGWEDVRIEMQRTSINPTIIALRSTLKTECKSSECSLRLTSDGFQSVK
jgi:RecA/RadA recombinase